MKNWTCTRNSRVAFVAAIGILATSLTTVVEAGPREQAKRIHDRLAGVPPTESVLLQMEAEVDPGQAGTALDAAYTAMQNPSFYNVTLKNFAAPWTNRDESVFVPLNDYIATFIGMVRDDDQPGGLPFNEFLSADILYFSDAPGLPQVSATNNNHYQAIEDNSIDMQSTLVRDAVNRRFIRYRRTQLPVS